MLGTCLWLFVSDNSNDVRVSFTIQSVLMLWTQVGEHSHILQLKTYKIVIMGVWAKGHGAVKDLPVEICSIQYI
jgi:hypothetical protein